MLSETIEKSHFLPLAHSIRGRRARLSLRASELVAHRHIGEGTASETISRGVGPHARVVRRWVVGAPAYFGRHGTPQRPRDLERHACLGYTYLATGGRWHLTNAEGVEETVTVTGPLSATNAEALEGALLAGIGIALQPDFLAWEALRADRLVAVLVGWNPAPSALNVCSGSGEGWQ